MRRTIEITVPPASTNTVLEELEQLEHVIGLSVERGASVKPPGDVVTVHTLNRGADDVLKIADGARRHGSVSVVKAELWRASLTRSMSTRSVLMLTRESGRKWR